jgi:hyperosmotically inducible periplasmic protein
MKRNLLTLLLLSSLSTACLAADGQNTNTAPDNTGVNNRDQSGETKTPGDQSNDPQDIHITTEIRRAIMKDANLSMTAKNIKIITVNGSVTLRGPVNTADEKKEISHIAKTAAGNARIDNELEVKASN